jgi:hypothetical protein
MLLSGPLNESHDQETDAAALVAPNEPADTPTAPTRHRIDIPTSLRVRQRIAVF